MPGRSSRGGSWMAILTANSVFCSVVPLPEVLALFEISVTIPWSVRSGSASTRF
jgi:hypothetical protein